MTVEILDAVYADGQEFTERVWRQGPVTVLWNQPEWVTPDMGLQPIGAPPLPKVRGWIMRRTGWRIWRLDIRVTPPDGVPLEEFGLRIVSQLPGGLRFPPIEAGNQAVWLAAGGWAHDAGGALEQAAKIFDWMTGIDVASAQLRVQLDTGPQTYAPCACGTWPTPSDARERRCRVCHNYRPVPRDTDGNLIWPDTTDA